MQIMSSPSMSDAADTPVSGSGGSPSPLSPLSTSKQILDFSRKDVEETEPTNGTSPKIIETTESERSLNSSPATLVPTPRCTPPMNGILTPPNDTEGSTEQNRLEKPGGRLKFFKDGVLCLELTHHGEGERTKWVQIRTKTVFPTLVHAVKEATIPCHSTPSSFASPSSLTHNHRVESSTSHSLSDDASSMLSSPRARDSHWKQPVPQRGVSACLQFFMKPAPCALKVRGKLRQFSQDQLRKRWPYSNRRTDNFVKLKNSVQCCCDESSCVLKDSSSSNSSRKDDNLNDVDSCNEKVFKSSKITDSRKVSLQKIVTQLEKLAESQSQTCREIGSKFKSAKINGDSNLDSGKHNKSISKSSSIVTPKKRLFTEVDAKESAIRPKKKSPNRSHQTILNVPGLNSEFYKRHHSPVPTNKPPTKSQSRSSPLAGPDITGFEPKISRNSLESSAVHKRTNRSPHFGAKSSSPNSSTLLKSGLTAELVDRFSPLSGGRIPSKIPDDHLPRHQGLSSHMQEQKFLQQQTVSKAISYTINSLLGTGSVADAPANLSGKSSADHVRNMQSIEVNEHNSNSILNAQRGNKHNSSTSARPDQDQKSFLRHLLDTSDPIPPVKSVADRNNRSSTRPSSVNQNRNSSSSSSLKAPKSSSNHYNHQDLMKKSVSPNPNKHNSGRSNASLSQLGQPSNDSIADAHQSIATNLALSSLMSSFPLNLTPPYDLLTRGANPHSTDALTAAAAALQYGSLIPGNLFSPMNSTMAAAMAASYFGVLPNFPMTTLPKDTISPQTPSPRNHNSSNNSSNSRRNQETVNNQRSWSGAVNGHLPTSSPSFRNNTAASSNSHNSSRSSSAISTIEVSSCGALNLSEKKKTRVEETVDMDAPLDLCKKSSR